MQFIKKTENKIETVYNFFSNVSETDQKMNFNS